MSESSVVEAFVEERGHPGKTRVKYQTIAEGPSPFLLPPTGYIFSPCPIGNNELNHWKRTACSRDLGFVNHLLTFFPLNNRLSRTR